MSVGRVSSDRLAVLVEAVLAGADRGELSAAAGVDLFVLDEAVDLYRAAGRAALDRGQERVWFQARVVPAEWDRAESVFAAQIGPHLDALDGGGWWFVRKYPCWRLRISTTDHAAASGVLERFTADGTIAGWKPGIYEPETTAFGGSTAMGIVHDLFCADSRGVLSYSQVVDAPAGRRELSLLLIRTLQQHAGLDWFESADVFDRVAALRPVDEVNPARVERAANQARPLLAADKTRLDRLFSTGEPLAVAAAWRAAFAAAGTRLGLAAADGRLDRGLRAILAHIVIFHWNRLGMSGSTQGLLARAAAAAMFPPD